jgi:hypothetical protein
MEVKKKDKKREEGEDDDYSVFRMEGSQITDQLST